LRTTNKSNFSSGVNLANKNTRPRSNDTQKTQSTIKGSIINSKAKYNFKLNIVIWKTIYKRDNSYYSIYILTY